MVIIEWAGISFRIELHFCHGSQRHLFHEWVNCWSLSNSCVHCSMAIWYCHWLFVHLKIIYSCFALKTCWDFPDGPVVKTTCSQCREHRFDPSQKRFGLYLTVSVCWLRTCMKSSPSQLFPNTQISMNVGTLPNYFCTTTAFSLILKNSSSFMRKTVEFFFFFCIGIYSHIS